MRNEVVQFAEVDCKKESDLCKMIRVRSYPSLYFIKDGYMYKFEGRRDEEEIQDFIKGGFRNMAGVVIPDKLPGFFEEVFLTLFEIKTEIKMIYQSGNYWAIGILSFFAILIVLLVIGITIFSFSLCWQNLFKRKIRVDIKKD